MTTTAVLSYEERRERSRRFAHFLVNGPREPWEPLATRAEVVEVPCSVCRAEAGAECRTAFPFLSFLGRAFPSLQGIHACRYLDRTHDPR
jgi:hypothetical protein